MKPFSSPWPRQGEECGTMWNYLGLVPRQISVGFPVFSEKQKIKLRQQQ